jgi:hypothetical protein
MPISPDTLSMPTEKRVVGRVMMSLCRRRFRLWRDKAVEEKNLDDDNHPFSTRYNSHASKTSHAEKNPIKANRVTLQIVNVLYASDSVHNLWPGNPPGHDGDGFRIAGDYLPRRLD